MKILMVNKFLFPNGGSETYIFKLGEELCRQGHEVQYFGMEHPDRIVGNIAGSYTAHMDFHAGGWGKIFYPFKTLYSFEARKKIRRVLDDFNPDVVHLNNINFQITPSIIHEIKRWEKQNEVRLPIVYTAHDYQWVCPNHLMLIPASQTTCFQCEGGRFMNCTINKCIHNSRFRSLLGSMEAFLYQKMKIYDKIDCIICPSYFLKDKLATSPILREKLWVLHNFIDIAPPLPVGKKDYVLYFGRFSAEKGVGTLLKVCGELPEVPFIFAGSGILENELALYGNIKNVGFQTGQALRKLIAEARFSIFPSEWFENCPFSVMESQCFGTPVIAAAIGGVPELLKDGVTGELFEPGNAEELKQKIIRLWEDSTKLNQYNENCKNIKFSSIAEYCRKVLELYQGSQSNE